MTDAANTPGTAPLQAESAASSELSGLNARTARRQKLLLGSLGALALIGGSWFILGGDDKAKTGDPNAAQTIDTAGLVNRDLSQREFVATYGNRLDAVTREQKALKDGSIPRSEIEAQLAALKAENQAMRVDGQSAIDAISAENAELKTRLAAQPASPAPAVPPPAYGPQAGGYDARARSPQTSAVAAAGEPQGGLIPSPGEVKLMSFSSDKAGVSGLRVGRPEAPPVVVEDSPDYLPPNSYAPARVIVGVDASAGVASQTDPLPVVLRILVLGFNDGAYPPPPSGNPFFLDSEVEAISNAIGLQLPSQAKQLDTALDLFARQIGSASDQVIFLLSERDRGGSFLSASSSLPLISRLITAMDDPESLVVPLTHSEGTIWDRLVAWKPRPVVEPLQPLEVPTHYEFDLDLLSLRKKDDGTPRAQSPSRLEKLLISPLAWVLAELGAEHVSWQPEALGQTALGKDSGRVIGGKEKSIIAMRFSIEETVRRSNGQIVERRLKNKESGLSGQELEDLLAELLDLQGNRCALTGMVRGFA